MIAITARLLTAEEFAALPAGPLRRELVQGKVVETMPPGGLHGIIAARIAAALVQWSAHGDYGLVGVESGFVLARDPDTVRAPDVYYVRRERLPTGEAEEGFWTITPDLAVEIVSPSDTAEELHACVRDYLTAGSAAVWVVYPRSRTLVAHTPDGLARTFGPDSALESPDLLPGLRLEVSELFANL